MEPASLAEALEACAAAVTVQLALKRAHHWLGISLAAVAASVCTMLLEDWLHVAVDADEPSAAALVICTVHVLAVCVQTTALVMIANAATAAASAARCCCFGTALHTTVLSCLGAAVMAAVTTAVIYYCSAAALVVHGALSTVSAAVLLTVTPYVFVQALTSVLVLLEHHLRDDCTSLGRADNTGR